MKASLRSTLFVMGAISLCGLGVLNSASASSALTTLSPEASELGGKDGGGHIELAVTGGKDGGGYIQLADFVTGGKDGGGHIQLADFVTGGKDGGGHIELGGKDGGGHVELSALDFVTGGKDGGGHVEPMAQADKGGREGGVTTQKADGGK